MTNHLDITIYILFRNRDSQLRELLESFLVQQERFKKVILSDNSDPTKPENLSITNIESLQRLDIEIVKRENGYKDLWEHISACAKECTTKWVCFLHDDDLLLPNFSTWINSTETILRKTGVKVSAIAPNSYVYSNKKNSSTILRKFDDQNIFLKKSEDLLDRYYSFDGKNIAAFPTYIYKTSLIEHATETPLTLGNYSDVQLLSRLINIAPILWTSEIVFVYRLHGNNMVSSDVFKDRLKTLRWISSTKPSLKNKYRLWLFLTYLKNKKSKKQKKYLKSHSFWIVKNNSLTITKIFLSMIIVKLKELKEPY